MSTFLTGFFSLAWLRLHKYEEATAPDYSFTWIKTIVL